MFFIHFVSFSLFFCSITVIAGQEQKNQLKIVRFVIIMRQPTSVALHKSILVPNYELRLLFCVVVAPNFWMNRTSLIHLLIVLFLHSEHASFGPTKVWVSHGDTYLWECGYRTVIRPVAVHNTNACIHTEFQTDSFVDA